MREAASTVLERLQVSLVLSIETAQDLMTDLRSSVDVCLPSSLAVETEVSKLGCFRTWTA